METAAVIEMLEEIRDDFLRMHDEHKREELIAKERADGYTCAASIITQRIGHMRAEVATDAD